MTISSAVLMQIRAHAASEPGTEVCGLLFGSGAEVTKASPAQNVATNKSRSFEIDPAALFAAIRTERAGGPRLLGYYHSHPGGVAKPSAADRAMAQPDGKLWLIVVGDAVTGWRAGIDGLEPVDIG